MKLAIVGSRRRCSEEDRQIVDTIVRDGIALYGVKLWLISGGCPVGADGFTEQSADRYGVSITVHYPIKLPKAKSKEEAVARFYSRNRKIADDCDHMYALISADRSGGTENAIKYAKELNKPITLIFPDGSLHPVTYQNTDG